MTCANCTQPITDPGLYTEDGFDFCSPICRYDWRQKGKPVPKTIITQEDLSLSITKRDMIYPVTIAGFEGRELYVKLSYWTGARLVLDGEVIKRSSYHFFSRSTTYRILDNRSQPVTIVFRARILDIFPEIEINGAKHLIARPLNIWEYVWIGIPGILMFFGGGLGGFLGFAGVFSNSIAIRKFKHPVPRYIMTGGTTLATFLIFWQVILQLNPISEYLLLKSGYTASPNRTIDLLTSRVWTCVKLTNDAGVIVTDNSNPLIGARWYFKSNGTVAQVFRDNTKAQGTWSLDTLAQSLTATFGGQESAVKIIEASDHRIIYRSDNVEVLITSDD